MSESTPPPPAPTTTVADREATLRAEIAAERVSKQAVERDLHSTRAELDRVKSEVTKQVETAVGAVTPKLTKLQGKIIDAEIKAAAHAAGLVDLDLLPLVDKSGIKLDDNDNVVGVTEAFEALKGKKPDWFKQAQSASQVVPAAVRVTGAPAPTGTPAPATPQSVKALSPAEYRAQKNKFLADLKNSARN